MLPLVKNDPWLNPVSKAVDDRHNRYEQRLNNIKNNYGSLKTFATAHQFWASTTTNVATAGGIANGLPPRIISR